MTEPNVELEYKAKNLMVYVKRTRDGKPDGGGTVAEVSGGSPGGEDMAKRIAAALNALEGVPTAAIVRYRDDIQDNAQVMCQLCGTGERGQPLGIINAKEMGITEAPAVKTAPERYHQLTPEEVMEEIKRQGLLSKEGANHG